MQSGVSPAAPSGWAGLLQLFPSAGQLVETVKSMVRTIGPLAGPKVAQVLRKGISDAFQTYTTALTAGFQKHQAPDGSFPYSLGMFGAAASCFTQALQGCHHLLDLWWWRVCCCTPCKAGPGKM